MTRLLTALVLLVLFAADARAQAPLGAAELVNTVTAGAQETPAVARDAAGRSVVVWTTANDGDGKGIAAQSYSATGAKTGSEFPVNLATALDQARPAVAMSGLGATLVVWEGPDASGGGVHTRFFDAAGAGGGEFAVNTTVGDEQGAPDVAGSADGFLVVWQSRGQDGDLEGIYARKYDGAGVAVSAELPINATTAGAQTSPAVAALADGGFVVVWESAGNIVGRRLDAAGAPVGGEFVANGVLTGTQKTAAVAGEPNGGWVVVWSDDSGRTGESGYGIFASRFSVTGLRRTTGDVHVNTFVSGDQTDPAVAVGASGDWTVVWNSNHEDGDRGGIYGQVFTTNLDPVGRAFPVSDAAGGNQGAPDVVALPNGVLLPVWQHSAASFGADNSVSSIVRRRFSTNVLMNGSVEPGLTPWTGRNLTAGSVRTCPVDLAQRVDGSCVLRAVGSPSSQAWIQSRGGGGTGETFELSGTSRSDGASTTGGAYEVAAVVTYADTTTATFRATQWKGTHGWETRSVAFTTAKPYTGIVVEVRYYAQTGTAWFDEVRLLRRDDPPPAVTRVTPEPGKLGVPMTGQSLYVQFAENVTVTGTTFGLDCGAGPIPLTVTPAAPGGVSSYKLVAGPLTPNATCRVDVTASQVTDTDTADPGDAMTRDFRSTFKTILDTAPIVSSTVPANLAVAPSDTDVTIQFNEAVDAAADAFDLQCPPGSPVLFSVSPPLPATGTTFTLDPAALAAGDTCDVIVTAAKIKDDDVVDPPDAMAADYTSGFTTDAIPDVLSTTPADGAGIPAGGNVTVEFTETVDVTSSAFTLECPSGTAVPFTLVPSAPGGSLQFILDPTPTLTVGDTCEVTVVAAEVSDTDLVDPPQNLAADTTFSFTVDAAPTVASSTPAAAAVRQAANSGLTLVFSEPVDVSGDWFEIACTSSGTQVASGMTVNTADDITFVADPADFDDGEGCTVTVVAAQVSDQDTADGPDTMDADHSFSFEVGTTVTFGFNGAAQSWTVPAGVTEAVFTLEGAQGGSNVNAGGLGGRTIGTLTLTPGAVVEIRVGGQGTTCTRPSAIALPCTAPGGFNGGGTVEDTPFPPDASDGSGGGATDVRTCATPGSCATADRVLVAGGGGGSTNECTAAGAGGGTDGGDGCGTNVGHGGSQTTGGAGACAIANASGANGGDNCGDGGAGGGGYFGGGGGGGGTVDGAGGGGSGYCGSAASCTTTAGVRSGNGQVVIVY
jgi:hypothetical protein